MITSVAVRIAEGGSKGGGSGGGQEEPPPGIRRLRIRIRIPGGGGPAPAGPPPLLLPSAIRTATDVIMMIIHG